VQKWSQRSLLTGTVSEGVFSYLRITLLEHTAYSPDLTPSDFFFLFPKIKVILKGRHFDDTDDKSNTTAALKAIPQNQFQNCFEGWIRRWHRCIASQGEYFEGDHGGFQQ
jgi:hypothetical protein